MPSKEITGKIICDKECEHVFKVCSTFQMKTKKDYHNLYLKYDFLLLAEMFEKFRNNSLKNGLCPSRYLSAPALVWDVMLNLTKVELEFISVDGIYLFFEVGMRGEFFYNSRRYNKANNNYLKSYDQNKNQNILYT